VAIYCTKLVAELFFQDLIVPTWLTTIACVFSGPALLKVIVQYRDYQIRRQAAALDAVLPPTVPGSIGGLHILFTNTDSDTRYPGKWTESSVDTCLRPEKNLPGEALATLGERIGYTFSLRFLFEARVSVRQMRIIPTDLK
jgi:hypothetical protein